MSDPRIESDDCGTRLIVDTSDLDFDQLTSSRTYITVPIDDALAFYEHVERTLGSWAREGIAARRAVAADDARRDALLEAGDHLRKARREDG